MMPYQILLIPVLLFLTACASGPGFDTQRVDLTVTPRSAVAELTTVQGQQVLWGGVILNLRNLENLTRIEVLAYPLNGRQLPKTGRDPVGRFILETADFLEPTTYTKGRLVTVTGTVVRSEKGKVGNADYVYPVVEAGDLYLWPRDSEDSNWSNIHFGIGVGISL